MRVVIGLGANLGDRLETLREAVRRMAALSGTILARSRLYETAPIGPDQPDYLNASVLLDTALAPLALLDELRRIEASLGRDRARELRWGPRTLDLDVLWIAETCVDLERLTVPHPRLHERAFAVLPLLDVVPSARDPRTGATYVVPEGQDVRALDEPL